MRIYTYLDSFSILNMSTLTVFPDSPVMFTLKDISPQLKTKRYQRKIGISGFQVAEGDHHFGPVMGV